MTPRTAFVCEAGRRYWPVGVSKIAELPIPTITPTVLSGRTVDLVLPDWAADLGVGEPAALLVLPEFLTDEQAVTYDSCDWFGVVDALLNGALERQAELQGRISHAYSSRIDVDPALFDSAWVNRIFLFLRRWAAHREGKVETLLLGELPRAEIWLTHDVDAVSKTAAIRIKQVIMHILTVLRCLRDGRIRSAIRKLGEASRFFFSKNDYWQFSEIRRIEEENGLRSAFFLYAKRPSRKYNLKKWLIDPSYQVADEKLRHELHSLRAEGWEVGVHPSFWSWLDSDQIAEEREIISKVCDDNVVICRQHWFRFSWMKTWCAQHDAGIKVDTTLGMNDRPGFRNASALAYQPLDPSTGRTFGIVALPTVLMDSHFYDYREMTDEQRRREIARWIDEVVAVHGQATVLWHQRVLAEDYGWKSGFEFLVEYARPYVSTRTLASLSGQDTGIP